MATTAWQPKWWNDEHLTAWERVREAMKRDWEQTKHDMKIGTGHELRQDAKDTIKQAAGKQPIPPPDEPNPAKVLGEWKWDEAEYPISYGYAAHRQFGGEHPTWNESLENKLRTEWEAGKGKAESTWDRIKHFVKYGYDYKSRDTN